jgi:hypothetical protein
MVTHFTFGSSWGVPRAAMALLGLHGWGATAAHLVAVRGAAGAMLPALGIGPPPTLFSKIRIARRGPSGTGNIVTERAKTNTVA